MTNYAQPHRYGKLILHVPEGRWYWSEALELVTFIPYGKIKPTQIYVMRKANTETNALRMIAHRYLGATRNGPLRLVSDTLRNKPVSRSPKDAS